MEENQPPKTMTRSEFLRAKAFKNVMEKKAKAIQSIEERYNQIPQSEKAKMMFQILKNEQLNIEK